MSKEDVEDLRVKQDETRMATGDLNIPIHDTADTDGKGVVLHRIEKQVEGIVEEYQTGEKQPKTGMSMG